MPGSFCIEARVEIVLKLTPPREPVEARKLLIAICELNCDFIRIHTSRRVQRSHLVIAFGEASESGKFYNWLEFLIRHTLEALAAAFQMSQLTFDGVRESSELKISGASSVDLSFPRSAKKMNSERTTTKWALLNLNFIMNFEVLVFLTLSLILSDFGRYSFERYDIFINFLIIDLSLFFLKTFHFLCFNEA